MCHTLVEEMVVLGNALRFFSKSYIECQVAHCARYADANVHSLDGYTCQGTPSLWMDWVGWWGSGKREEVWFSLRN